MNDKVGCGGKVAGKVFVNRKVEYESVGSYRCHKLIEIVCDGIRHCGSGVYEHDWSSSVGCKCSHGSHIVQVIRQFAFA